MSEMEIYRVEVIVKDEGMLIVTGLPLHAGERVEVIVRRQEEHTGPNTRYPLRGKPFRYDDPFGSVAEEDWDLLG